MEVLEKRVRVLEKALARKKEEGNDLREGLRLAEERIVELERINGSSDGDHGSEDSSYIDGQSVKEEMDPDSEEVETQKRAWAKTVDWKAAERRCDDMIEKRRRLDLSRRALPVFKGNA